MRIVTKVAQRFVSIALFLFFSLWPFFRFSFFLSSMVFAVFHLPNLSLSGSFSRPPLFFQLSSLSLFLPLLLKRFSPLCETGFFLKFSFYLPLFLRWSFFPTF